MPELMFALIAAAAAWLWHDAMRARERTLAACRRACREMGAPLLDETVVLDRLRLGRDGQGHLAIDRRYRFEFSLDGHERRHGWIRLTGSDIVLLQMDHPDGPTLLS